MFVDSSAGKKFYTFGNHGIVVMDMSLAIAK